MAALFNSRHYIAIGTLLCEQRLRIENETGDITHLMTKEMWAIDGLVGKFSVMFQKDNPRFDPDAFCLLYMTGKITKLKKRR